MLQNVMSQFSDEAFSLRVLKNFVGEPIRVTLTSGINKFHAENGYVTIFCGIFCLTVPKNAVGESFSLSIISHIEKVWMRGWWGGGSVKTFRRKVLVSQCRKKSQGNPSVCH